MEEIELTTGARKSSKALGALSRGTPATRRGGTALTVRFVCSRATHGVDCDPRSGASGECKTSRGTPRRKDCPETKRSTERMAQASLRSASIRGYP